MCPIFFYLHFKYKGGKDTYENSKIYQKTTHITEYNNIIPLKHVVLLFIKKKQEFNYIPLPSPVLKG